MAVPGPVRRSRQGRQELRKGHGWSERRREGGEDEEVAGEAETQLKLLLGQQMDTSTFSLQRTLRAAGSKFTSPVAYQTEGVGVAPLRSVERYRSDQETLQRVNSLRGAGLSEGEVELVMRGGEKSGVMVEPSAMEARKSAIQQKFSGHATRLEEGGGVASGVLSVSRHVWEVECSQQQPLNHLLSLGRARSPRTAAAFPAELLGGEVKTQRKETGEDEVVPALPLQVIERNRLTTDQIRKLPRFASYSPGQPTSVLYIKNLHRKTSADDLSAIFGCWREGVWPKVRVLTGRMGGQAFVKFQDVGVASQALEVVNGYLIHDKPLVITYGHQPMQ